MNIKIYPSNPSRVVIAPPSKSVTHRALILAALATGTSTIKNILLSDDTIYTLQALQELGVSITQQRSTVTIEGTGGNLIAPSKSIQLGNSGSSLRMLAGVASLAKGETILTGEERLQQRPMKDLLLALSTMGITTTSLHNNDCAPIKIKQSMLKGGTITINGNISSQYITALLLIAPFAKESVTIHIQGNLRSKPYIDLTIDLMQIFGVNVLNNNFQTLTIKKGQTYKNQDYSVEGDYSSASYFFAAAAITKGTITVTNLKRDSKQADASMLSILEQMGCKIVKTTNEISVTGSENLQAVTLDMNNCPDIVQTVAVVAAFAKGTTHITNIGHLKDKETDRILSTSQELRKMGISVSETAVSISVMGRKPKGAIIDTHNDHRMAMSFAIAALGATGETIINNADVVNKSYPNFWEDLQSIGAVCKMSS